jgi:hypothetical protein
MEYSSQVPDILNFFYFFAHSRYNFAEAKSLELTKKRLYKKTVEIASKKMVKA